MNDSKVLPLSPAARTGILTYLGISAAVFLLMMMIGLLMRASQAEWIQLPANFFYQVMTAHGAGMVGISGLAASAVLWYFLRRYVDLSVTILWANLAFFLTGVVLILGGIFLGGFGGGWTFLFPLPSKGLGMWEAGAAASFMIGLLLIGVGFLLFYLDVARAILSKYGNLSSALGWPQLFFNSDTQMPPATIVASTMVVIVNTAGIIAGAVVLVVMLINLFNPEFAVDALLAKNLIYFFGHVFINATIYQAVIAVYELLPEYTKRPWKVNRVFLAAWTASSLMVMAVYPHHLLMDFVMPTWAVVLSQILSYANGIPLVVVTAYGALTIVHKSGIKWDAASRLLFLSMFGWAAGVIPAIIDATVNVNSVMHNTMWVPGHFHFYLLLGLVAMLFGFMYYMVQSGECHRSLLDKTTFWVYLVGAIGFASMFLVSGRASVPRRWAEHLSEWVSYSQIASIFGALVVIAVAIFAIRILTRLPHAKTV